MYCPKCKKEIDDNTLKCNFCGTKVGSLCKDCGTYNPITAVECINCKKLLIRKCSECGAANLPEAKSCRKCGIEFVTEDSPAENNSVPIYTASANSQQKTKFLKL